MDLIDCFWCYKKGKNVYYKVIKYTNNNLQSLGTPHTTFALSDVTDSVPLVTTQWYDPNWRSLIEDKANISDVSLLQHNNVGCNIITSYFLNDCFEYNYTLNKESHFVLIN